MGLAQSTTTKSTATTMYQRLTRGSLVARRMIRCGLGKDYRKN